MHVPTVLGGDEPIQGIGHVRFGEAGLRDSVAVDHASTVWEGVLVQALAGREPDEGLGDGRHCLGYGGVVSARATNADGLDQNTTYYVRNLF